MYKRVVAFLILISVSFALSSCKMISGKNSLGKTNNTAVTIADAMNDYLQKKNKGNYSLYGIESALNGDNNGIIKLYYSAVPSDKAAYTDILVAEVDSKTGHVERLGKANYAKDGLAPYEIVKENESFDAASLPIDSGAALSAATRTFSSEADFYYDYVQIKLICNEGLEQYEIRLISMLNDLIYCCNVDAVSGVALHWAIEPLK